MIHVWLQLAMTRYDYFRGRQAPFDRERFPSYRNLSQYSVCYAPTQIEDGLFDVRNLSELGARYPRIWDEYGSRQARRICQHLLSMEIRALESEKLLSGNKPHALRRFVDWTKGLFE